MKTIRRGSKGDTVKLMQRLLIQHGYSCDPDGIFGAGTEKQVRLFQKANGLDADGIVGTGTWRALEKAETKMAQKDPPGPLPPILTHIQSLGHDIMWEGDYHLNLFGIRCKSIKPNSFDDILGCAYTIDDMWRVHYWPGTCDPGTFWLENPSQVDGTAILVPGQYKDTWKIDKHQGKYEALCQRAGEVKVYRDANRDNVLDESADSIVSGYFGINLHRSSATGTSTKVEKWSAGCQVHARIAGFNEMMSLAKRQLQSIKRDTFTYTLINQWW